MPKTLDRCVLRARAKIARRAEENGAINYANEVRAGKWDHREDVQDAIKLQRQMSRWMSEASLRMHTKRRLQNSD
jgi:hypothetical protein